MRTRNSHRTVTVWESFYDDCDNLIDEELMPVQREWIKRRHGENRGRTIRGRSRRQHAPYHNDPLIWILMSILQNFAFVGVAIGMIEQMIARPKAREVTQ